MASTITSAGELRAMQIADLERELAETTLSAQKLRLGLAMQKEKDSAKYRRERRHRARLLTILREKRRQTPPAPLKKKPKSRNVSAPAA
jgi:ribosomal protein L29